MEWINLFYSLIKNFFSIVNNIQTTNCLYPSCKRFGPYSSFTNLCFVWIIYFLSFLLKKWASGNVLFQFYFNRLAAKNYFSVICNVGVKSFCDVVLTGLLKKVACMMHLVTYNLPCVHVSS